MALWEIVRIAKALGKELGWYLEGCLRAGRRALVIRLPVIKVSKIISLEGLVLRYARYIVGLTSPCIFSFFALGVFHVRAPHRYHHMLSVNRSPTRL